MGAFDPSRRDARGRLCRSDPWVGVLRPRDAGRRGGENFEGRRRGRWAVRRRVRNACRRRRGPRRAPSAGAGLRRRRHDSRRLSHGLLRLDFLRRPQAGRMGSHPRRGRGRGTRRAADCASPRCARHRYGRIAGETRVGARPRRGVRLRLAKRRIRRRRARGSRKAAASASSSIRWPAKRWNAVSLCCSRSAVSSS